jgi:hypothetical protein
MFRADLLSIIRSLNTVFTAIGICHTQILKMGKITIVYVCIYIYMCVCIYLHIYKRCQIRAEESYRLWCVVVCDLDTS